VRREVALERLGIGDAVDPVEIGRALGGALCPVAMIAWLPVALVVLLLLPGVEFIEPAAVVVAADVVDRFPPVVFEALELAHDFGPFRILRDPVWLKISAASTPLKWLRLGVYWPT
jgi:hypothetical protein